MHTFQTACSYSRTFSGTRAWISAVSEEVLCGCVTLASLEGGSKTGFLSLINASATTAAYVSAQISQQPFFHLKKLTRELHSQYASKAYWKEEKHMHECSVVNHLVKCCILMRCFAAFVVQSRREN